MKGIVLAGGTGSRLKPLTNVTNKHLLPVGRKPMIFHAIEKLIQAQILDIMVISGIEHMGDVISLLGSGYNMGCTFTYKVQEKAGGIAQALGLAENFSSGQKIVVILGDNVFESSIISFVDSFKLQKTGARLLIKEVPDPERYGVATIRDQYIDKIVEKPKNPESHFAVTGIYAYDSQVFSFIKSCRPSDRGELEISDVNNFYIRQNQCEWEMLKGWWTDAGTFTSYQRANEWAYQLKD
jgi:glucose-1-phosphate thymidylyltransferase